MASTTPSVSLWVKAEPFTYGVFQVHPHPRLALHNIKKLVTYAKSKGKSGFPKLSYPVWKHIACNKLQISEDLAWTLFHTCIIMSATHMYKLKELELKLLGCKNDEECEQMKNVQSTELFRFVLFLHIQQINKISLRASAVSPNAEWPTSSKAGDMDSGRNTPIRPSKNQEEQNHLQFVLENLMEILDLLVEPDSYGLGGGEANLSTEAVDALSFVLEGTCDRSRSIKPFNEIAHMPALISRTGYSKISRSFSVRGLYSWIRSCLTANPYSLENCINNGKRLHWPMPGEQSALGDGTVTMGAGAAVTRRQRIATTANFLPKESGKGNKLIFMSMVSHQTVTRCSGTLQDSTLKVHRCHYSYLYLLSPVRCVSVEKCRKLTLVLGPVENTLHVSHCDECIIIAPTRRVVVTGCRRCTFYLHTTTRPLLVQSGSGTTGASGGSSGSGGVGGSSGGGGGGAGGLVNEDLILAPYHTFYPKLGEHLARSGVDPSINLWDQPLIVGGDTKHENSSCWEPLPPRDFYPMTVPLEMEGDTTECPCSFPPKYQAALNDRDKAYTQWQHMVKEAKLNGEQRRTLLSVVEQRFKSWLVESGNQRQLNLLDSSTSHSLPNNGTSFGSGRRDMTL